MRYATRALVIGALVVVPCARAVCIDGHIPKAAEVEQSWAVVIASVESEREVPPPRGGEYPGTEYELKVHEVLRGKPGREVRLFSEHTSGAYPMDVGSTYLAFIRRRDGVSFIDYCGNSGKVAVSQDLIRELRASAAKGK